MSSVEVVLKPVGRGRWSPLRVKFEGKHAVSIGVMLAHTGLGFQPGQRIELGGIKWRVCSVSEGAK
jgi:hypothetical protein